MSRSLFLAFSLTLAAGACGEARLYPYLPEQGGTVTCPDTMVGYAAVGGEADGGVAQATNGGKDSTMPPITVRDVASLTDELQKLAPRIIYLDGMLATTETIKVTPDKDFRGGNKTLIGMGANSGLTGAGLDLGYSDNIIIRNLRISKVSVGEGDAITILQSHHIWIDHCDLSSDRADALTGYDGLVDITHGSSYITVSWTQFHDHGDTTLVGHSSDPTQLAEDAALSVTYHHNLFLRVNSGPRIRFGNAHVFSNHFQDVTAFGVASESMAYVFVQANLFDALPLPITTAYQDPTPGTMREESNSFPPGFTVDIAAPPMPYVFPYTWSPDAADSVSAIVSQCAGTGKMINFQ